MINVKMSNKLLFLIFLFIITINNSKADQGDLEKLYRAVSKELNIGTYEDFKAKMQTVADRKRFYEKISEQYDLGAYEIYEKRLGYLSMNSLNEEFLIREDYLKLLWDNFAQTKGGFDNYEEFKSLMSNHNARKVFYEQASEQGYDLGPYEVYEQRLKSVGSNQYSKRDSVRLLRESVYKDMDFESQGRSYDKFLEIMSNNEKARLSVYSDLGLEEHDISYERFLNKMGLDYKRQLWEDLNKKGFYTKSFEEFENQFSTPDKVQTLFNKLVDGDYFKGSNLDFIERYFSDIGNSIYTFLKANNLTVKNEREFVEEYAQNADKQKILYNFFKDNKLTDLKEEDFFIKYCPEWTLLNDGVISKDSEAKQNDLSSNINWQIITWIVIGLILMALLWYLFKTGIIKKISSYLSNVFYLFKVWFKKNKKTIGVSVAVILTIAIITNPSVNTFKSFLRSKGYPKAKIEHLAGRYANFYIFSIYKY